MKAARLLPLLFAACLHAQTPSPHQVAPFPSLAFLQADWDAKAEGSGGVAVNGTYRFSAELKDHILARHSTDAAGCKGPRSFDCEHGDQLYIYRDSENGPIRAIYFDNEGHVIHYSVTTPTPFMAVFLSDNTAPGPRFKLVYELKDGIMLGRFQVQMPGSTEWKSYLEWKGGKRG